MYKKGGMNVTYIPLQNLTSQRDSNVEHRDKWYHNWALKGT